MQSDSTFAWHMPVALEFGAGCLDRLAPALGDGPAVLLFEGADPLGLGQRLRSELGSRWAGSIEVPDGRCTIDRAAALARWVWPLLDAQAGAVLVAVGGGSVLDVAKLLRCRPRDGRFASLVDALRGNAPWPAQVLAPLWLVPTTAGTGGEVTRFATVWDSAQRLAIKRTLDAPFGYADRAFVDPELSLDCPRSVTRDCALDALTHALEALWNRRANPVSSVLAVAAAQRVVQTLPTVLARPDDLAGRHDLALAALQAGMALSQTRSALVHALSYPLTLEQGLPHGLACGVWLPTAWRLAVGRVPAVDAGLARIFETDARTGGQRLLAWLADVGVDADPRAFGIYDVDRRITVALASERGRHFIGSIEPATT